MTAFLEAAGGWPNLILGGLAVSALMAGWLMFGPVLFVILGAG